MTEDNANVRGSKGGRPRKGQDLRREIWLARHSARTALYALQNVNPYPTLMSQQDLGTVARLNKTELARMAEWFPAAVDTSAKAHQWNLDVLGSIMIWDDPVVMLQRLLASDQQWWNPMKDAETHPCTLAQEEAIRIAAHQMSLAGPTVIDDPMLILHFERFRENASQRLK